LAENVTENPNGPRNCRVTTLAFAAVVAAPAIVLAFVHDDPYTRIDSEWYTLIAQGRTAEAMQPFTARQLAPLLARGLTRLTHASLPHCFLLVGLAAILTLACCVGWLLCRNGARWPAMAAVAILWFWPATFANFMLPDTLSACLLALFLLALWKRNYLVAAAMLLPMFVARESTILVLLCLLITGWRQLRARGILLAIGASALGMAMVRALSSGVHANREQLSPLAYMAGKVPWNFAANVVAMRPWMPSLTNFCAAPRYTFHLPMGLHAGGSSLAGLCGWDAAWQAHTLLLAMCSFGLLPLLTIYLLRYHRRQLWRDDAFTRFCVVYGALSFLIAPLLGHTMERLFFYGWPVCLLAVPIAASDVFSNSNLRGLWIALFAIHFATAWLAIPVDANWDQRTWQTAWTLLVFVLALNAVAWLLLRRMDRSAQA
jgi:hypothetical protein